MSSFFGIYNAVYLVHGIVSLILEKANKMAKAVWFRFQYKMYSRAHCVDTKWLFIRIIRHWLFTYNYCYSSRSFNIKKQMPHIFLKKKRAVHYIKLQVRTQVIVVSDTTKYISNQLKCTQRDDV